MTHDAGYARIGGLEMYYEVHGSGAPLLVVPGAYMTVELMGEVVPALAKSRQVIGVELQAHGHTADIDRPFSYEQFADDTAALLSHLGVDRADVYGYSLGGAVALQLGLRHPERVRKLVIASASFSSDGLYPEVVRRHRTHHTCDVRRHALASRLQPDRPRSVRVSSSGRETPTARPDAV
jgi:pimeloyl-ACP methyl ester carboxylesterase